MVLIGICGGSGSGKTTFARTLASLLSDEGPILSQDNYYYDEKIRNRQPHLIDNFDHPEVIDFTRMGEDIDSLKKNFKANVPKYCFLSHNRLEEEIVVSASKFLILEGHLIFYPEFIRRKLDIKIFLDVDEGTRLIRRIRRDSIERGRNFSSVIQQYEDNVKIMHDTFVEPQKEFADFIVNSNSIEKINKASCILSGSIKSHFK